MTVVGKKKQKHKQPNNWVSPTPSINRSFPTEMIRSQISNKGFIWMILYNCKLRLLFVSCNYEEQKNVIELISLFMLSQPPPQLCFLSSSSAF